MTRAAAKPWFEVDKAGLAKILERRGKAFVLYELVQNALDEGATRIDVTTAPVAGRPLVEVAVIDDVPDGFKDLSHAFTLFAESPKKADAEKMGRYDLGEKLVLALCDVATVTSTTGGLRFDASGRTSTRARRERGTEFRGLVKMTREEMLEVRAAARLILIPPGCVVTLDGETLAPHAEVARFTATLLTEVADKEGVLRRRDRQCEVIAYEPRAGEEPHIYEMAIPVVESEGRYHVSVRQRVPLSIERDNVPPAYLRLLRALTLNATADKLEPAELARTWVTDAIGDKTIEAGPLRRVVEARFGAGAVSYDPSDPGSKGKALSHGVQVVHAGSLPGNAWDRVREHGAMTPAGQLYPDKPSGFLACASVEANLMERDFITWCMRAAFNVLDRDKPLTVRVIDEPRVRDRASWDRVSYTLTLNRGHLGPEFFATRGGAGAHRFTDEAVALMIHEFAHDFDVGGGDDHLSAAYYDACCTVGARLYRWARS